MGAQVRALDLSGLRYLIDEIEPSRGPLSGTRILVVSRSSGEYLAKSFLNFTRKMHFRSVLLQRLKMEESKRSPPLYSHCVENCENKFEREDQRSRITVHR